MKADLTSLLKGPHITEKNAYVLCALSDLDSLLQNTSNAAESENNVCKIFSESQFPAVHFVDKKTIKSIRKKIVFFSAYCKDYLDL